MPHPNIFAPNATLQYLRAKILHQNILTIVLLPNLPACIINASL